MGGSRRTAGVRGALALLALLAAAPVAVRAQASTDALIQAADRHFAAGRFGAAERGYYAAVRARPRDPAARIALARYLGARGRTRVAAVLLEEARRFGGDSAAIARLLAPLYERAGRWRDLALLSPSPLSPGERQRAGLLAERRYAARGADSAVLALSTGRALGTITALVGEDTVTLVVDPLARGLVLDASAQRAEGMRAFVERDGRALVGIAAAMSLGALRLSDVPVRFAALGQRATGVVGLDFLGDYAPTVDARRGTITLRLAPPAAWRGEARPVSLERVAPPAGRRWTLDGRLGRLWVE